VAVAHPSNVSPVADERFAVDLRGHQIAVDQTNAVPDLEGGPSPVDQCTVHQV
jgi:hypothetical protein